MALSVFLKNFCFYRKARFLLQKLSVRSQNWCLTIPADLYSSVQPVVRHHIWDFRNYPRNGAWRLSGTSFGTVRYQFWDRQAPVLGSSGISFGISRLFFGYKKDSKRYNEGCFSVSKGVLEIPYINICYISSHSDHVNHPYNRINGGLVNIHLSIIPYFYNIL